MKSLHSWFEEYAVSHKNEKNILIHYICVPLIFFSIVGLLMSIPPGPLDKILPESFWLLENWAVVALLVALIFYIRLSIKMAIAIGIFSFLCILGNYFLSQIGTLWILSLGIFVLAWIGQFYGHKIEGKKPSFAKDLQFLLIGPAWILQKWFKIV
ncbi:DUF962 domain-containing protein [Aquimarina sp. 2-A2]|uniref:Putative membrane protein YGL010W n=1 Tax=Aquimarina intermedia TaxID=350814 RepID=A0A5S5C0I5_9FLAO|nr:Mpo1-like protein [Aquimarina intermedia]TYP72931.1 putative membrane protein YGL010W [Aquimarina intermedia]